MKIFYQEGGTGMRRNKHMKKLQKNILFLLTAGMMTACSPADQQVVESSSPEYQTESQMDVGIESTQAPEQQSTEAFYGESFGKEADRAFGENFTAGDVYVIGTPILSDCLFLKVNMTDIENIEDNLRHYSGEERTDGSYFIYEAGEGITYVTHSTMNGDLYAVILTTDQFQLGCGLKVGMREEDISSLSLPFVPCSKEDYPMDSRFLNDIGCPLNTLDYDRTYLYQFGGIPEDATRENSIITGGRISITALVKDGMVISVFTNIPVAG